MSNNSEIKVRNPCVQSVNYNFTIKNYIQCSPEFSEVLHLSEKLQKFDKIVRNIFRGIFLRMKFSPENFPEILEVKHTFTAGNLSYLKCR
jgi:hypothetical protein